MYAVPVGGAIAIALGVGVAIRLATRRAEIGGAEVMAVEVYPSTMSAPAELQTLSGRGDCGIVAIRTGARR